MHSHALIAGVQSPLSLVVSSCFDAGFTCAYFKFKAQVLAEFASLDDLVWVEAAAERVAFVLALGAKVEEVALDTFLGAVVARQLILVFLPNTCPLVLGADVAGILSIAVARP